MRRKKKDMKLKYIVLLGIAFIVLVFVIFSFTLKEDRKLNKFEWLVKDSVMAIERVVLYPFNYVVDKVGEFFELKDIREKYEVLKNSLDRVDSIEAENKLLRKELEDMACLMYEYCLWNYYNQLQKKNKRRKRRV